VVEDDKNMDEAFVRMSEDFQVAYNKSFWEDARINLENESLDAAFREAANTGFVLPGIISLGDLDDAFMDDAFRDAALATSVSYSPDFWTDFQTVENQLQMDVAFQEAAAAVDVNYSPLFWEDANDELVKEGLHYEYTPAYWNEARVLLDQSDRRIFFARWSAVAILLILVSFIGIGYQPTQTFVQKSAHNHESELMNGNDSKTNFVKNSYNSSTTNLLSNRLGSTNSGFSSALDANVNQLLNSNTNVSNESTDQINVTTSQVGNGGVDIDPSQLGNLNQGTISDLNDNQLINDLIHNSELANGTISDAVNHEIIRSNDLAFTELLPINLRQIPTKAIDDNNLKPLLVTIEPKVLSQPHSISVLAGAGLGKSFGSTDLLLTKRIYGGVAYNHQGLGKFKRFNWGARVTVNYNQFDELEAENQSINYKEDGSYSRSWSHVQMRESYYVNPSIYSSYQINKRNILRVGVGMEQLVAVRSNMAYKLNDDLGIQTVNNNWGVKNGMKKQDFQFSLGYEFKIKDYLGLQMSMNCGMFDRTDDTFFRQLNVKDRETTLTFGLNYTLLRK
jgi:hypothetical protein